ncbi:MAG: carboxymuconolactone decarboxylase family protein [Proteobacteria bacterium]|nr:MAG: carboxymuconolactone decarboxylase family protein [Pseudomonadota bacterium]QKK12306.1 MAG: carboxymuconolactone decarboxylase family protein [Pseudomonadota bacterium]
MARIPPLYPASVEPSLASLVAQAEERLPAFLNQVLTLAHHPQICHDLITLYLGFQTTSLVDRRLIELAVLTVSHLNRCVYCVSHHTPLGQTAGLSDAALAELENGPAPDSPHFSSVERLVIAYARQMTLDARRVPDALFEELRARFSTAQLVELTVRIGLANFFNRLNDALQIDLEPGVDRLL